MSPQRLAAARRNGRVEMERALNCLNVVTSGNIIVLMEPTSLIVVSCLKIVNFYAKQCSFSNHACTSRASEGLAYHNFSNFSVFLSFDENGRRYRRSTIGRISHHFLRKE